MIELRNVNKYFNRHRKNEIHVINDTSLTLSDKGLVAFLGESGCGKTTLLNAIGGLNKIDKGKIFIDGMLLPKRSCYKKDKLRTLNIGYIFQNYNLIENMTVYDNVALSLKMIGIKDKEEIKEKVTYVLEKVGMYRYRNRLAVALSGGQRQRVGIARAIVKNPKVIIADEPTGNLDSKNTIEVMNIIKAISKEKLVILVTHEKSIANFYASKIINLEDGKITNVIEDNQNDELDYRIDNNIYLKDFNTKEELNKNDNNITIYKNNNENINLDIVVRNNNIYIRSNNNKKIEVLDNDSNITLINDSYKTIKKEDYLNNDFDINVLSNEKHNLRYTSIYNPISLIIDGINKVRDYKLVKKILLFGFFISSMFILYSLSNIKGVTKVEDKDFISMYKDYIYVEGNGYDTYNKLKEVENSYILPGKSTYTFNIVDKSFYQISNTCIPLSMSVVSNKLLKEEDLIAGTLPKENNEVVIDKLNMDRNEIADEKMSIIGIRKPKDIIGKTLKLGINEYKVVGVTDIEEPIIYMNESEFSNILLNITTYKDSYNIPHNTLLDYNNNPYGIKEGRNPENDYEVLININNKEAHKLNSELNTKVNDTKLKVVGYYETNTEDDNKYINKNTLDRYLYSNIKGFTIYSFNKKKLLKDLQEKGFNARDQYKLDRSSYIDKNKKSIKNTLILSSILLAISFIEIFLIIRASFITRIKEIGIKRAIGIKKIDIYKMFLGEILVITTITGIPGNILMYNILKELTSISKLRRQYEINYSILLISIIIMYVLNIVIGLLPVFNLVRKEPSDILSRNDVD